jgi:hypothetical protein
LKSALCCAILKQGIGRIAMAAAIVLLLGLMFLATQLMGLGQSGEWPSITLASEFGLSSDRAFSEWALLDRPLHFIVGDVQFWIILVLAAGILYWLIDWASELIERAFGNGRARLRQASGLADPAPLT